jgi:hypothetical protein
MYPNTTTERIGKKSSTRKADSIIDFVLNIDSFNIGSLSLNDIYLCQYN